MSMSIELRLKANGEDVEGESTIHSQGREGSIECIYFRDAVSTAREKGSGMATGRRRHEPLEFWKRIDKSSPILARALCNNEVIEATFKFFRPNPDGDGTTEQFFTITVGQGRIAGIERISSNALDPASADEAPQEKISIVYGEVTWEHMIAATVHTDSWQNEA